MDAITAKDMGAFPDTNLAESLQRITGVSIERERGEGKYVTVRGFGQTFNLVLLNGRQMPTTGGDSRSFDFSNLASEGIRLFKYSKVVKQMYRLAYWLALNITTTVRWKIPDLKPLSPRQPCTTPRRWAMIGHQRFQVVSNTFADAPLVSR